MAKKDKKVKAETPVEETEMVIPEEPARKPNVAELVVDYEVIQDANLTKLKAQVRHFMKLGWQPLGGVSFHERIGHWYQAITLREII